MGWYISWGLWVGLQNRPVFCSNRTIYQETIYRLGFVFRVAEQATVLLKTEISIRRLSIGWGLCLGLQNRPMFCSKRTIYQKTIYRLGFVCRLAEQDGVLLKIELSIRWLSIGWGFSGMDVKQDSVLIAIRYVLLDFRQNGHEKWYVYLLHFVVNCIAYPNFPAAMCKVLFSVQRTENKVVRA